MIPEEPGAVCNVCECWYPQDNVVYGTDAKNPTDPLTFWCKMHAEMYNVKDIVIILPKQGAK